MFTKKELDKAKVKLKQAEQREKKFLQEQNTLNELAMQGYDVYGSMEFNKDRKIMDYVNSKINTDKDIRYNMSILEEHYDLARLQSETEMNREGKLKK